MANEISIKTERMREALAHQVREERKLSYESLKENVEFYERVSGPLNINIKAEGKRVFINEQENIDVQEEGQEIVSTDTLQGWYKNYILEYYKELPWQRHRGPVEDINQLWEIQVKRIEIGNEKAVYTVICCDVRDQYILAARVERNPYNIRYKELLEEALESSPKTQEDCIVIHSNMNPYVNVKGMAQLIDNNNLNYKIIKDYQGCGLYSDEVLEEIVEKISALVDMSIVKADIFRKKFFQVVSMHNTYYTRVEFLHLTRKQFRGIRKTIKELSITANTITTSDRLKDFCKK